MTAETAFRVPRDTLLYTIAEAQAALKCSRAQVYHLANRGLVRLSKMGGRTVILRDDMEALLSAIASGKAAYVEAAQ